jgi:pimeloyl-ACP methyl ester carboxylesterase
MELMAQCVKSVLDQINVKKYLMVGHSMGGYVSLAFGEKHADALKGLCLIHSTCTADSEQKKIDRNRAIELVKLNKQIFINQLIHGLFEEKNKILYKKEIQKIVKEASALSVQGINAAIEGMRDRLDREIVIRFAPFPVYFLAGENDPVFDMNLIRMQTEIPRNKIAVFIPNCGHMAFIEQKAKYIESLKLFVQDAFK